MELESESTIPKLSLIYATAIRQLLITPISQSKELKPRALRHLLDQGHKRVNEVPEFELTDPKAVSALPTAPHCFCLQHVSIEGPTKLVLQDAWLPTLTACLLKEDKATVDICLLFFPLTVLYSATPLHLPYSPFSLSKKIALWLILSKFSYYTNWGSWSFFYPPPISPEVVT